MVQIPLATGSHEASATSQSPISVSVHPHGKEIVLDVQSYPPLVHLWAIPVCCVTGDEEQSPTPTAASPPHLHTM